MNLRLAWIDWMKTIGITLVVFGHFHTSWSRFICVFHVPLFFLISGMLCKVEMDKKVFWKKLFYNLVLPMVIICNTKFLISDVLFSNSLETLIDNLLFQNLNLILGKIDRVLGTCWFIYTLVVMKVLYQYAYKVSLYLGCIFLLIAYFLHNQDLLLASKGSALQNVLLSYVFFVIGTKLHPFRASLIDLTSRKTDLALILTSIVGVGYIGLYHGVVDVSYFHYGKSLIAFVCGGILGSIIIFEVTKYLNSLDFSFIRIVSLGTIVILGFHGMIVSLLLGCFVGGDNLLAVMFTVLLVAVFIPAIRFTERYLPYLIGKYRVKKIFE